MAFTLSRIDRLSRSLDVTAKFAGLTVTGVDVALLTPRSTPTAATVWTAATYAAGVATMLLAGPDADSSGALVVPASADLWMRVTDAPEVNAEFMERITVLGGGSITPLPSVHVASVNGMTGAVTIGTVPAGGSSGQVLAKASNTDFDTAWVAQTGGGGGGAVASVNGQTGAVVLTAGNVGAQPAGDYATNTALTTGLAGKQPTGSYATTTDLTTGLAAKVDATDPRLTDTRVPTDSSVTNAKVASGAAINADKLADGTTNKLLTATERTKLAGIATAATANRSDAATDTLLADKAPLASPAFTGTPTGITKTHVGLGNVDNTADTAKPVSNPQATALATKVSVVTYGGDLAAARPVADAVYWVDFPSTPTNAQAQDIVSTSAATVEYAYLVNVPGTVPPTASSVATTMAYQAGVLYNVRVDAGIAISNYMEWEVGPLAAGTYSLRTIYIKGTNAGISTISVDGTDLGTTINQYATFSANNVVNIAVTLTAGRHKIRYRADTKDPASTAYAQSLQAFSLTRTGA